MFVEVYKPISVFCGFVFCESDMHNVRYMSQLQDMQHVVALIKANTLSWLCVMLMALWGLIQIPQTMYAQTQKTTPTKQPQTKQTTPQQKSTTKQPTTSKEIPTPQEDAQEEMLYGGYPVVISPPLSPDKQWSGGVLLTTPFFSVLNSPAGGVSVGYALSPALHVGAFCGLATHTDTAVGTQYVAGMFGRLIFRATTIKPIAELVAFVGSTRGLDTVGVLVSQMGYGLRLNLGAQYFITQNVGVRGTVALFNVQLQENGIRQFGILAPTVGIEWFF